MSTPLEQCVRDIVMLLGVNLSEPKEKQLKEHLQYAMDKTEVHNLDVIAELKKKLKKC